MPDELLRKFQADLDALPKTPENLNKLTEMLLDALQKRSQPLDTVAEIEERRQQILREIDARSKSADDVEVTKSKLMELGKAAYESGIPQAILAFGAAWKLYHGIFGASEQPKKGY